MNADIFERSPLIHRQLLGNGKWLNNIFQRYGFLRENAALDKKLPLWKRMRLRMHLAMCGVCSQFRKTMIRVDREIKQHANEVEADSDQDSVRLSDATRNRIQRQLTGSK